MSFLRRFALACAVGGSCLGLSPVAAADAGYPLTLDTCGQSLTIAAPPQRIVSIGQSATEILYLLGAAERVAGTAVWLGPVLPGFEDVNAAIPRLADNDPSFESVVSRRPDLVTAQFQWHVGPNGVVATREQFHELSIPVYTSPADCIGKDNSDGGDGVRHTQFSMGLIHQEVEDLALILGVPDQGARVVADLKAREEAAKASLAGVADRDLSAVFWFSSAEMDIDPYVAGQNGAPGYIMKTLGLRNVIDSAEEWPTVGWETIAKADPDLIVVGKMTRRRFPADDVEKKLEFLKTDPVAREMTAVKEGRIVILDAQAMNPTIRTIDGIEIVAEALRSREAGQ